MMEVVTRRRSIGGLARFAARHRRASAALAVVGLAAGLWAWWATQLRGLPDIGDPFDVAAFEAAQHVPDERNAFLDYRLAASLLKTARWKARDRDDGGELNTDPDDWAGAKPVWRALLAESGEALAALRAGSEKPDSRYDHPEGLSLRTLLPVTQELRTLAQLAVLEGSRLESEGDVAAAWGWYRAALRASRHSGRHGCLIERLIGNGMHISASKALTRWASDHRVDAPLLRRALDEVIAIDAMTVPRSEPLKLEYLVFTNSLGDPNMVEDLLVAKDPDNPADWCQDSPLPDRAKRPIQAARVIVADDRERSLRVSRLMMANWLAQVDKPAHRRSKLNRNDPPIYEADPSAPPPSMALPPEELSKWLDSSLLASRHLRWLGKYGFSLDMERSRQAALVVHLAGELYRRDHGGAAPASPQALVGPYLKALPECFDRGPGEGR